MIELRASDPRMAGENKLPQVPKKVLEKLRIQARTWACEDGIADKDLKKYMLDNINMELELLGYRSISKIR